MLVLNIRQDNCVAFDVPDLRYLYINAECTVSPKSLLNLH